MFTLLLLWSVAIPLAAASSYQIAPITPDMQSAADAIIAEMLPASGVTQQSSVGWQRLAYISGR